MRKIVLMVLSVPFIFATQSCINKARNYNKETEVDQEGLNFIQNGIEAGHTEISASLAAESRSKNPRVIAFAKMMIADHTMAGDSLNQIRIKELVDKPDSINQAHKKAIDSISKFTGSEFDKAYMQMMVGDHIGAVKLFTDASSNRSNTIQKFAKKTLPTLQMHLDSAKAINASLK